MDQVRMRNVGLTLLFALVPLFACGEDNGVEVTDQDFTGSYTLVSFSQGTAAGVTQIPGATGTMTLTATTYQASLTIPPLPTVNDQGTYTAQGTETSGTWSQQSSVDVNLQYAGTYTWDPVSERLTLDTTAQAVRTVIVVQKN